MSGENSVAVGGASGENGASVRTDEKPRGLPTAQSLIPRARGVIASHVYAGNARTVFQRDVMSARSSNALIILSGFFEPVLYLLSMGLGVGALIGGVQYGGHDISYGAYIAPALLATSAMNGAIYDSTMNVFFKMHYGRIYHGMLATPLGPLDVALGEISYALARGFAYSLAFMLVMWVMGFVLSPMALLAIPGAMLIAFAFACLGFAVTSYTKSFVHLDWIGIVLLPMFLLSATFFPITVYPEVLQWLIIAMPLWHGVEMVRMLATGYIDPSIYLHIGYYVVLSVVGITVATRRLTKLFLA